MIGADKLAEALKLVSGNSVTPENAKELFSEVLDRDIRLAKRGCGEFIAHVGLPMERVHILLCGSCYVFNYSPEGKSVMSGICAAPQIFGLFELVRGGREHTATVEAVSPCILLEVSRERYLKGISQSGEVARYSLKQLAAFIDRALARNDRMLLNTPTQNLLIYLYEACGTERFPLRLTTGKSLLAQELNLNSRTLYRKLGELRKRGLIGSEKGKITINEAQYREIREQLAGLLP